MPVRSAGGAAAPATATTATTPASLARLSASELAKARAEPLLAEILGDMKVLTSGMMPHDRPTKDLRKKLAKLRDTLDVFVHWWGGAQEESWKRVRKRVDDGYEILGQWKDLFDSQNLTLKGSDAKDPTKGVDAADVKYDAAIVTKRRAAALAWKDAFNAPAALAEMQTLIASPAATPQPVKEANLTRFFWGAVDIAPDPAKSGVGVVKDLGSELIDQARAGLTELLKLADIRGEVKENQFHDVRKRLRSLANLASSFPEIVNDASKGAPLLKTVSTFVSRFGDVEDTVAGLHIAMEERDAQAIPLHQQEVDDGWVALKKQIVDDKLDAALAALGKLV